MCDPTAILATQAAGAGTSAAGAYYSARGEKSALKAQADMADTNAAISELTAQSALRQGQAQEQNSRLKTADLKSSQRASMAANGIDIGAGGTAKNILETTDLFGEIDADTIAANAARSAWGYRTEAVNYKNDARLKRTSARGINPALNAGVTLLDGATSVAKTAYTFNKLGAYSKKTGV